MRLLNRKPDILPGVSEDRFLGAARRYVESAFPNPDRVGCPDRQRLDALARRNCSPADHMGEIDHIVTCSPCFVEYQAIRSASKRRAVLTAGGVAAALVTIVFAGVVLLRDHGATVTQPPAKPAEIAKDVRQRRVVDLRPYERQRGGAADTEPRRQPGPVFLDRALLEMTVQLPIGSEEGRYRFTLTDAAGVQKVETSGDAIIRNYITIVEAPFDLRAVSPGRYTLTVRRIDGIADVPYPVEIR
jgi:hypothetical protein